MARPDVNIQGKAVLEFDALGEWMLMLPDGSIEGPSASREPLLKKARAWARQHASARHFNALVIETRIAVE